MMRRLHIMIALFALLATPTTLAAQSEEWFVGSHPEYHAAMVRDIDGIFMAIYVTKEPSIYASPLLMETIAPACVTERPIEFHSTEAIMANGATAAERLNEVRQVAQSFFDRSLEDCQIADDLESRFFYHFDDAYLATDELLVEAGIFPLADEENGVNEEAAPEARDPIE